MINGVRIHERTLIQSSTQFFSWSGCLIGRLLPRTLLTDRGVGADSIVIKTSQGGKPFIAEVATERLSYLRIKLIHRSYSLAWWLLQF